MEVTRKWEEKKKESDVLLNVHFSFVGFATRMQEETSIDRPCLSETHRIEYSTKACKGVKRSTQSNELG